LAIAIALQLSCTALVFILILWLFELLSYLKFELCFHMTFVQHDLVMAEQNEAFRFDISKFAQKTLLHVVKYLFRVHCQLLKVYTRQTQESIREPTCFSWISQIRLLNFKIAFRFQGRKVPLSCPIMITISYVIT